MAEYRIREVDPFFFHVCRLNPDGLGDFFFISLGCRFGPFSGSPSLEWLVFPIIVFFRRSLWGSDVSNLFFGFASLDLVCFLCADRKFSHRQFLSFVIPSDQTLPRFS